MTDDRERDRPEWAEEVRQRLLGKGKEVAGKLEKVLAGKDVDLTEIARWVTGEAPKRPEERLRAFLDLIEGRRKLLEKSPEEFRECEVCGEKRPVVELREVPWSNRCREHASDPATE